ncbi:hypothetical protein PITCH_A1290012 [uncultured Desulfobacterium sp.]|uniref:Lysine-specific metallo-endopeptidase domain-containing protein n=1 Tax=uncultured Desulfobacterium sp. TaxID=201089 RepID=A0A445MSB3_9BACT|nr:hypothetical protein PITCH_A1290012 [uncultured Desulfobacterium sp.]
MALRINGIGGKYILPNVLRSKYRFSAFDGPTLTYRESLPNGRSQVKSVNMKRKIDVAWEFITKRAAAHTPCNNYFKTLLRRKSLKEVLVEGDIVLHCLVPKDGYTLADLPDACTAGRDIGINPYLLIDDKIGLAPVLIHELAHVAGASTNPDPYDKQSLAAEKALLHCLCSKQYRPEAIGSIQIQGSGGSRIV